jgi:hypothetical protein
LLSRGAACFHPLRGSAVRLAVPVGRAQPVGVAPWVAADWPGAPVGGNTRGRIRRGLPRCRRHGCYRAEGSPRTRREVVVVLLPVNAVPLAGGELTADLAASRLQVLGDDLLLGCGPRRGHPDRSGYGERYFRPAADGWCPARKDRPARPVLVDASRPSPGRHLPPGQQPSLERCSRPSGRGVIRLISDDQTGRCPNAGGHCRAAWRAGHRTQVGADTMPGIGAGAWRRHHARVVAASAAWPDTARLPPRPTDRDG